MDTQRTGVSMLAIILLEALLCYVFYPMSQSGFTYYMNGMSGVGYMHNSSSIVAFPISLVLIFALWWVIPYIEPMQKNFESFRESYNGFFLVLAVFTFYLFALMLGSSAGWDFDFRIALAPALALLLAAIGVLLPTTKRNYFVGIRTPWTLSSDKVWKRTHIIGSKLFYMCAVWAFAGAVYPEYLALYLALPLTFTVIVTVVYSYIEFRRQKV